MSDRAAIVEEWSLRLADAVSPDEAILAPTMAEAFMAGGKQRKQLFEESLGTLGGFGAGSLVLIVPAVLNALSVAAPLLLAALSSPLTDNLVKSLDNIVELLTMREQHQKPAPSAQPDWRDPELAPVMKALDTMQAEMRAKGISAEAAEAAAYRSLHALFTDPRGATQFVQAVAS